MKALWVILLVAVVSAAADDKRTWTFNEDGVMRGPSGRAWSFKKGGRVDAAFLGCEGTNVVLLAEDGTRRVISPTSLCQNDRDYLKSSMPAAAEQVGAIEQKALGDRADTTRKSEIARMRADAEAKRAAAKVENECGRQILASDKGKGLGREAPVVRTYGNTRAQTDPTLQRNNAIVNSELRKEANDRAKEDRVNLAKQAGVRFENATRLSSEAAVLEGRAAAMERSLVPQ